MARAPQPELRLRITVVGPPAGVALRMQRGRFERSDAVSASGDALVFEFPVTVADAACTPPRFTGPFAQGPADERFVYINVGTSAGQHDSPWTRRIKVPLYSIAPELVAEALATDGAMLAAKISGIGRDGTPACATVKLLEPWAIATARSATAS
jgi:hypothetical protein